MLRQRNTPSPGVQLCNLAIGSANGVALSILLSEFYVWMDGCGGSATA
jgi:hypothetical protein